ncbi:MAG: hypothetical protein WC437_00285 [Patescibacteria group bacterium]
MLDGIVKGRPDEDHTETNTEKPGIGRPEGTELGPEHDIGEEVEHQGPDSHCGNVEPVPETITAVVVINNQNQIAAADDQEKGGHKVREH